VTLDGQNASVRQTASLRRAVMVGGVLLLALVVSGGVYRQRRTQARERELEAHLVRSDSAAASLQRAVASMQSRDPVFARELAARALPREEATMEQQRLQRAVTSVSFAGIHDRNDSAVAMVASDLDGAVIAGTAFGLTREGQLVTNRHVVLSAAGAPARRIRVRYANAAAWLPARVVRTSDTDDLAEIQVEKRGTYPAIAGVSANGLLARPGSPVMTIGYPHAADTPSEGRGLPATAPTATSAGMVGRLRDGVLEIDSYAGTASVGAPVFDARGDVVGVVFGGAPESNGRIVYAVPWKRVRAFVSAARD
jgi:S1-C subfamily serine protease